MHISVNVLASDPKKDEMIKTTHCIIIFVAVDKEGKAIKTEKWIPKDTKDIEIEQYAKRLMELRMSIKEEMDGR